MQYLMLAVALAAILYLLNIPHAVYISSLAYLTIQHRWVYIFIKTFPRDLVNIYKLIIRVFIAERILGKNDTYSVGEIFRDTVKQHPMKTALISADTSESFTFQEVEDAANKISNIFIKHGFQKGDVVGIFMKNSIEYIPAWLGLTQIGVISALLNINQRGDTLKHSFKTGGCKAVLYDECFQDQITAIREWCGDTVKYFVRSNSSAGNYVKCHGNNGNDQNNDIVDLLQELEQAPVEPPTKPKNSSNLEPSSYIYTSGTTGLPKAAIVNGTKILKGALVFTVMPGLTTDDIIYNCLPLYHTSGLLIFTGPMLIKGCTVVIREKFSASSLLQDCCKFNVSYLGYIGEMCRFLLMQPESKYDRQHKIRMACGNGLRRSLYKPFQQRFGIRSICEFYGATEGNAGFLNTNSVEGSIGFLHKSLWLLNVSSIIRVDTSSGIVLRDRNGLAIPCKPGEPGMLVTVIRKGTEYTGYVNSAETEKKVVRNIFRCGDAAFYTGDLIVSDDFGNLFFVDRLGDTYRWKGENTSSTQIENIISRILNNKDVIVYPVSVPFNEGNAGMAYLKMQENEVLDINFLTLKLCEEIPTHSMPVFLRTGRGVQVTGTQKYKKDHLKNEGFSIDSLQENEDLYYFDKQTMQYRSLDEKIYERILNGNVHF